jgi:CPA2 family monovalent cation:H+ antiporter-2
MDAPPLYPIRPCDWPEPAGRNVIVAGYGPVGRAVVSELEATGIGVTVIELNLNTVERLLERGRPVVYGDAADEQVLRHAGAESADALILTIPDEEATLEAIRAARSVKPELFIVARTNHLSRGLLATKAGANHVIVEELVTAQAMRQAVLDRVCRPPEASA